MQMHTIMDSSLKSCLPEFFCSTQLFSENRLVLEDMGEGSGRVRAAGRVKGKFLRKNPCRTPHSEELKDALSTGKSFLEGNQEM